MFVMDMLSEVMRKNNIGGQVRSAPVPEATLWFSDTYKQIYYHAIIFIAKSIGEIQ